MIERIPKSPPKIESLATDADRPLWSVMIPSYNCIGYLRETIQSVLSQAPSPEEMQIEVIDDFSSDGDVEELVNELGNNRVVFFRQPKNVGSLRNFETCINRAKGKFIHILHGDDAVKSGFYQEISGLFEKYPDVGAAFTHCTNFNESSVPISDYRKVSDKYGIIDNWLLEIAQEQRIQTPCIVVKRSVYENLGSFFGVHYGEDWEMWTRIAAKYKFAYSPKPLACYRIHSNNITGNSFATGQNIKDIIRVINTIQNYLPTEHRKALKNIARKKYAYYITGMTDHLHYVGKSKTALLQASKAFQLHADKRTFYYLIKNIVKVSICYKKKIQE